MKFHGIQIQEGSNVVNLTVASGTSFPSSPNAGELYYRTDSDVRVKGLYLYIDAWERIASADAITAPSAATFPSQANVGDIFYKNSDDAQEGLYVYDGSTWIPSASGSGSTIAVTGDVDGTLTVGAGGTLTLDAVTSAGTFGTASQTNITEVDAKGRVLAVTPTAIDIAASQVGSGTFADARISESSVTQHESALELSASQTTSGTFADARISQSSVTQHQAALTISESQITDGLLLARVGGNETITGSWTFNNPITVGTPSSAGHATTKQYVDNLIAGLTWKNPVEAATTANITLSGAQTIDGVAVVAGNRVLVKNQSVQAENGVYVVAAGAWTRATDFDSTSPIDEVNSAAVLVKGGTTQADTAWTQVSPVTTIGTDAMSFVQFAGTNTYVAGTGLTLSGNTFNVNTASAARIVINADNIDLATVGTPGTYNSVTTDAYGRVTAGTVQPYATQAYVETEISKSVPAGAPGQVPFIAVDGTRQSDIDYIVTTGAFTGSADELTQAKNNVTTNEDVFNTWARFSHANLVGGTLTRTSNVGRFQFTSTNLSTVSASFPTGATITIVCPGNPTFDGTYTITSTGTSGSNHQVFFSNAGANVGTAVAGSINRDSNQPAFTAEINAWNYDNLTDKITSTVNSDSYIGFVSDKTYTEYTLESKMTSTSTDDDTMAVVLAWYVDENTGREYTLSAVRSPGGNSPTWGIIYNRGRSEQTTIVDGTTLVTWGNNAYGANAAAAGYSSNTPGWGNMAAYQGTDGSIQIKAVRAGDIITVSTSQWASPTTYYGAADLTVDLSQNALLEKFRGPRSYGFAAVSQANASVEVLAFSDPTNVIYDLENDEVWVYNNTTDAWEIDTGATLQENVGLGRLLFNPDTMKTYFVRETGSVELIATATPDDTFVTRDGDTMYGPLVIGTSSTAPLQFPSRLEIQGTTTGTTFSIFQSSNDSSTPNFAMIKTRGTTASSRTTVINNDALGRIYFQGTDGTSNITAARIDGVVDGTPSTGIVPGRLSFFTMDSAGTTPERLRLTSAGQLVFGSVESVGATTVRGVVPAFQIIGNGTAPELSQLLIRANRANSGGGGLIIAKSRGANSSTFTSVNVNDSLGSIVWAGSNGTSIDTSISIETNVEAVTGLNVQSSLNFAFINAAGSSITRFRIAPTGKMAIGTALGTHALNLATNIDGATQANGIHVSSTIQSDVTTSSAMFATAASTAAASFVLSDLWHFIAQQSTVGAGSTITNQTGFRASQSLTGATNNYGFLSNIPVGTGRWSFFVNTGNAVSYHAPQYFFGDSQTSLSTRINTTTVTPQIQLSGSGSSTASTHVHRYNANLAGPFMFLSKSRGATPGAFTIVQNGDELGSVSFAGADGTQMTEAATITAYVDGTPGANDMPGRLVFFTTADGSNTSTERMRISSDGVVTIVGGLTAANQTVTHTIATSNIYTWNTTNTDIDGLMAGTAAGVMFEGHSSGHFTIGLRSNDGNDSFAVLSKSTFGSTYDKNVFNVTAGGIWTFTGIGTAPALTLNQSTGSQLTLYRSAGLYLEAAYNNDSTSPSFTSFSTTGNAKPMVFNTKTDAANTPLTDGALGFSFQVYDAAVMAISTVGQMSVLPGSVSTPTYSFIGDADTGMYNVTGTSLNFAVNGVAEFTLSGGLASFGGKLQSNSNGITAAVSSSAGSAVQVTPGTVTDSSTAASGTLANRTAVSISTPTFAASNTGVTYTHASTMLIANAPSSGTNVTHTNSHALHVTGGRSFFAAAGSATTPTIAVRDVNTGFYSSATGTLNITTAGTLSVTIDSVGNVAAVGAITTSGASATIGYNTGAGGSVTQATSKATGVTLNRPNGAITMNAAALAANTAVSFTLTNSVIGANDTISVCIRSGATAGAYYVVVDAVAAGSCRISVRNMTAGSLSEAIVIGFAVINGSIT